MRIGLVDLDTSHPQSWVPILRDLGHTVVGVFDHADVHPEGYAVEFAQQHAIPRVFDSLPQMAEAVDLAILHGCNWDRHVERAEPFVQAGCALLIDKPVAGDLRDLAQFEHWARSGVRITGGSSLRFAEETRAFLAAPEEERGIPHTVLCGCAVDEFNYGIHAYSMLAGLLGPDAESVRDVGTCGQHRIEIQWADGRVGWVVVGAAANWHPFYTTIVTDRDCRHFQADVTRLYRSMLESVLPYLAGETEEPPVSPEAWLAPERWALAAKQSRETDGRAVRLTEIDDATRHDGPAFTESYRLQKYGQPSRLSPAGATR